MSLPGEPSFSYETSPNLFLFTSLTAGSSHITTATSRLTTILKARRVPFHAIDISTDDKARRIWTRRSAGKKLPGLVKQGDVLADLETVEEWNEYGEVNQHLGGPAYPPSAPAPAPAPMPAKENTPLPACPAPKTTTLPFRTRDIEGGLAQGASPVTPPPQPLLNSSKMRPLPPALLAHLGLPGAPGESPGTSAESTPRRETSPVLAGGTPTEVEGETRGVGGGLATQTHRGSEISIATAEEVREVEARNVIREEDEDDEGEDGLEIGGGIARKEGGEGVEIEGAKAADASKAGDSVGD